MKKKRGDRNAGRARRSALLILALVVIAVLALPMAAFAASNITQEYRYADGQPQPNIPAGFVSGGVEYRLVATSAPTREGDMPTTRTYTYRLSGTISPSDLAKYQAMPGVVIKEVDAAYERATNDATCTVTVSGLATNDLTELKQKGYFQNTFSISDAAAASGKTTAVLPLAEVSYTPVDSNGDGLPESYTATMIYRGKETFEDVHYYDVTQTITSASTTPGSGDWIIVATYAPVGQTNTITSVTPTSNNGQGGVTPPADLGGGTTIGNPPTPLSPVRGLSPGDVARIGAQTGNFFTDLFNGNIPLGSFSVSGSWSAFSMLLSLVGIVTAVISFVLIFRNRAGRKFFGAFAIVFGVLAPVIWVLRDNLGTPVTVLNNHTPTVLILVILSVICFALRGSYVRERGFAYMDE